MFEVTNTGNETRDEQPSNMRTDVVIFGVCNVPIDF